MTLPGNFYQQSGTTHFPIDSLKTDENDLVLNSVHRFACLFYEYDAYQKKKKRCVEERGHDKKIYKATIFLFLRSLLKPLQLT